MKFSVIYSVDVPGDAEVLDREPPNLDLWEETEGDQQYEYGYLGSPRFPKREIEPLEVARDPLRASGRIRVDVQGPKAEAEVQA